MNEAPVVDYATPLTSTPRPRLLSLDVFRGLVILAMLLVNNIGDGASTGYFWKHADWVPMRWGQAWRVWWQYVSTDTDVRSRLDEIQLRAQIELSKLNFHGLITAEQSRRRTIAGIPVRSAYLAYGEEESICVSPWTRIPLFTHCTLADYVMPWFMLIIGVAIPFSVGASVAKGVRPRLMWLRTLRRAALLVALGWILCYFRDEFGPWFYSNGAFLVSLRMDVLQLLGISYFVARVGYELRARPRAACAIAMFAAYWAILRFYPQGDVPRGTFTNTYNAIDHIYSTWHIWSAIRVDVGFLAIDWRGGVLSIIPAAATMLLGTLIGDLLRREDLEPRRKVVGLVKWGAVMCVVGFLWAFDLPFNKPRWTPCYLIWCSGVGTLILAMLYDLIDVRNVRRGTYPLVVFGTNAIALYWCSIMFKVLVLNTPRPHGKPLIEVILGGLKGTLGPWAGGWTFTIAFIGFWWVIMDQLYRRKIFLKL